MAMMLIASSASANDRVALAAYCLGSFEQGLEDGGPDTCAPADSDICRTIAEFNADLRQRLERLRVYVGEAMRPNPRGKPDGGRRNPLRQDRQRDLPP
jgi:hypothetical protein